jgi:hypothetical protein
VPLESRRIKETGVEERLDELVVLRASGGQLGDGEVVTLKTPAATRFRPCGLERDQPTAPTCRHETMVVVDTVTQLEVVSQPLLLAS